MAEEMTASQVLASLAILKVNWDKGHDYIDNFVPFAAEGLRHCYRPEVSLPQLQTAIERLFGIRIPRGPLKTILKRACRRGYVRRSKQVYVRVDSACEAIDVAPTRERVLREHATLIGRLVEFTRNEHSVDWTEEEAESALYDYLAKNGLSAIRGGEHAILSSPPPRDIHPVAEYVIASFIRHLEQKDAQGFEYLETVLKGSMLVDVLYFPQIGNISGSFRALEVYFDTNFLLRAMGHAGSVKQVTCTELLDLLYGLGANLRCFEHTEQEIRGILNAAARRLRSGRAYGYFETYEHFASAGYRPSDVDLILAKLARSLESLRVHCVEKPPYVEELTVDEAALEEALRAQIGYSSDEALRRDLDSLTAIHRLRGGRTYYDIDASQAILVTTNDDLARVAIQFFGHTEPNSMPLCLPDDVFATHAWLKQPHSAPDLPRRRLIADCYAALQPSDDLWRRYIREVDRLNEAEAIGPDDYHLLRYSSTAQGALMDATRGDAGAFTEDTIDEVLEKSRIAIRADILAEVAVERKARSDAEDRAEVVTKHMHIQAAKRRHFAVRVGRLCSRLVSVVLGVGLAIGLVLTWPGIHDAVAKRVSVRAILFVLFVLLVVASLGNLIWGVTVKRISRFVEGHVTRWVEWKLCELFSS